MALAVLTLGAQTAGHHGHCGNHRRPSTGVQVLSQPSPRWAEVRTERGRLGRFSEMPAFPELQTEKRCLFSLSRNPETQDKRSIRYVREITVT